MIANLLFPLRKTVLCGCGAMDAKTLRRQQWKVYGVTCAAYLMLSCKMPVGADMRFRICVFRFFALNLWYQISLAII